MDDSDPESSQIIANVFMEIGLKLLVGDKPAFIKLPHQFLRDRQSIPFAKDKFILEIMADTDIDADLLAAISDLKKLGFSIALDDIAYDKSKIPLIEQCELIKIDISKISEDELSSLTKELIPLKKPLLAKKVDTQDEFTACVKLGFTYFQGSFLSRPKTVKYKILPSNKLLLMQILAMVQSPDVEIKQLEEVISRDVGISFKLLRLINSANFGLSRKVESVHQAMLLLGMKEIKSWVSLVALSNIDSVPQEVTDMSMIRAKMCKSLAEKANIKNSDIYFTVGMFSLLDTLMLKSMKSILKSLPFSDEINEALLYHQGVLGEALDCTIAHEQGDWNMIKFKDLTPVEIKEIYIDTLEWHREIIKTIL